MDKKSKKQGKKVAYTKKKTYEQHVQNYLEELQKQSLSNDELFDKSKELLVEKSKAISSNASLNNVQILSEQYEAVILEIDNRNLYSHTSSDIDSPNYTFYPDYGNTNFNKHILEKKEFYIHKATKREGQEPAAIEGISKKICDPLFDSVTGERVTDNSKIMFNLTNSQKFLKTFMSPTTPYNSLLIYHGTGVGKTCTSIAIAEQYSEELKSQGKKIIILLNQSIKENFIKNIFNIQKLRANMPYYQCTGTDYLKYIPDYKKMSIDEIQKRILKIIKGKYEFYGYQKFANIITTLENKINDTYSKSIATKIFEKKVKEMFSNTVFIIDEAHNIKEGDHMKVLPPILDKVVSLADNMKLLLLTATPMFDNATEIIWLINLLLTNDNRPKLDINDYFDTNGQMLNDSESITKFKMKTRGLVSYVRGENPYRFPDRLYPTGPDILTASMLPKNDINGDIIETTDRIKELVLVDCKMTDLQQTVYNKMIESNEGFGAFKQPGIMCSNIVFPTLSNIRDMSSSPSSSAKFPPSTNNRIFNINNYIGDSGFDNVAEKAKKSDRVIFNIKNNIFTTDMLSKYSTKIHKMIEIIKKSEGVIFIYSQFINSGVIPIALALEHAGYSKYGGSLLEKEKRPNLGKYIIISGARDLSKHAYRNYLKIENDNKDGKKVKIIIGSETASEGLDFRFIRSVHILEPWFHLNKLDQVIGRGIRNCSHIDLPLEKRNVTVYFYTANSSNKKLKDRESLDVSIYREAEKKAQNMATVEHVLKTNSVDCSINKNNNVFYNDVDNSRRCNYKKCEYKCDNIDNDELNEAQLNYDTVNFKVLKDIIDDVVKILKVGNNVDPPLFTKDTIFTLDKIINYVNKDTLGILLGLHKLILGREHIVDRYGRNCYLEYKNGLYVLVPQYMSKTMFTQYDLRITPYKRTKKIKVTQDVLETISDISNQTQKRNNVYRQNTLDERYTVDKEKSLVKRKTTKKTTSTNTVTNPQVTIKISVSDYANTVEFEKKLNKSYQQILKDIKKYSSTEYIIKNIKDNKSKDIYDEKELIKLFEQTQYRYFDYLEPNNKSVFCEILIKKFFKNISELTDYEKKMVVGINSLYNIMTYNDVYYKDVMFKGNLKDIWGYKLATTSKTINYYKYNKEMNAFKLASAEEVKNINKSFKKRQQESPIDPYLLVGYVELKMPQKKMIFKIRDKRSEGKKGTQLKTGSICNNDGMKKNTIIDYIRYLFSMPEYDFIYKDVNKKDLPNKSLLCLQLETYLRYFDSDKSTQGYFYNYEQILEHKLTEKKID
tara:strand:+ start:5407 stop:9261 length:3855 start_codon:yes stop_codon:yes gene_type:complete